MLFFELRISLAKWLLERGAARPRNPQCACLSQPNRDASRPNAAGSVPPGAHAALGHMLLTAHCPHRHLHSSCVTACCDRDKAAHRTHHSPPTVWRPLIHSKPYNQPLDHRQFGSHPLWVHPHSADRRTTIQTQPFSTHSLRPNHPPWPPPEPPAGRQQRGCRPLAIAKVERAETCRQTPAVPI